MTRLAALLAALCLAFAGAELRAEAVSVPSGQPVRLVEVRWDDVGEVALTARYRFVAPEIARDGGSVGITAALDDIVAICASFVLPRLQSAPTVPDQIVISLADRDMPFGVFDASATILFEAFSFDGSGCVWEGY